MSIPPEYYPGQPHLLLVGTDACISASVSTFREHPVALRVQENGRSVRPEYVHLGCKCSVRRPLLRNSVGGIASLNLVAILERLMKLSTISLVCWLAGFFALFQSFLNALAEVMRFGDREFYTDWWNSPSVGTYWRTWNKPVYQFMRRHVFSPLIGRGWGKGSASIAVFVFSGILHELLVGVPTHNIIGK